MQQHEAWLLSLAVELPLLAALLNRNEVLRVLVAGVLATSLTHPVAWWAAGLLAPTEYTQGILVLEAVVWITESTVLRSMLPVRWSAAAAYCLFANTASATVGWLAWKPD